MRAQLNYVIDGENYRREIEIPQAIPTIYLPVDSSRKVTWRTDLEPIPDELPFDRIRLDLEGMVDGVAIYIQKAESKE